MFSFIFRIADWFLRKAATALLIVVLSLAAYATWLFLHDSTNLNTQRAQRLETLTQRRSALGEERSQVEHRIEALRQDLSTYDDRIAHAGRIIEGLTSLRSRWERWFGNSEQQRSNEAQIEHMRAVQAEARQQKLQVQRQLTQAAWQREGLELQIDPLDREIASIRKAPSPVIHYATTAWYRARWWVAIGVFFYFVGPWFIRIVLYFGIAPLVTRGKTICFAPDLQELPQVNANDGSIPVSLWPGEVLTVRQKYLAESDSAVSRRTRTLLNWRLPLTSLLSGLFSVVELHNRHAGAEHRIVLARAGRPKMVFAVVQISEGSALILRPKFLAGVIHQGTEPLVIRSRWRLFHRQSWVTFQFRYVEFVGPCRLIVTARDGLHVEQLVARDVGPRPIRRISPLAAIGFTPNVDCALVRTERFWRYLVGRDPLIEMCFAGPGLVLARDQNVTPAGRLARFWSPRWNRLLRVIGA